MLHSKSCYRFLCYQYILLLYLLVFVAGFYFTSLPSSRHSAFVRGGMLLILIVAAVESLLYWYQGAGGRELRASLQYISRPGKLLAAGLVALFGYYMLQSGFYGDWDSVRRVLTVAVFILCVAFAVLWLDFDVSRLVCLASILGVFFALCYDITTFNSRDQALTNPFRDMASGLDWFASYHNTIIAGLHWSLLALALIWAYTKSQQNSLRLLYLVSGCVVLFAVYHTAARTAWVATMFGVAALFLYMDRVARLRLLLLVVPSALIAILYSLLRPEAIVRKGLTYRDDIWIEHIHRLESGRDWIFGKGIAALEPFVKLPSGNLAIHPHSIYIESLYTGGLVALLLFIFVLGVALCCLLDRRVVFKGKDFFGPVMIGAIVAMIVDFNDLFGTPNLVWLWFWLPMAVLLAGALKPERRRCSGVIGANKQPGLIANQE